MRGLLFLAFHDRVVAKAYPAVLICHANVVNRLLNLSGITLFIRIQKLETLAQENPEAAAAQFAKLLVEIVAVRRIFLELDDRDASARLLPVCAIEFPRAQHTVAIPHIACGKIHVQVRFKISQQIAMRAVVWILPNLLFLLLRQPFHPAIFLVVALNHLCIRWFSNWACAYTRIRHHALAALNRSAQHDRQERLLVEPVVVPAQHRKCFRVACISRFQQSMREPRASVGRTLRIKNCVFGIRHDVSIRLTAFLNSVDHNIEATTQLRVVYPAHRVARAHQKTACV